MIFGSPFNLHKPKNILPILSVDKVTLMNKIIQKYKLQYID